MLPDRAFTTSISFQLSMQGNIKKRPLADQAFNKAKCTKWIISRQGNIEKRPLAKRIIEELRAKADLIKSITENFTEKCREGQNPALPSGFKESLTELLGLMEKVEAFEKEQKAEGDQAERDCKHCEQIIADLKTKLVEEKEREKWLSRNIRLPSSGFYGVWS